MKVEKINENSEVSYAYSEEGNSSEVIVEEKGSDSNELY